MPAGCSRSAGWRCCARSETGEPAFHSRRFAGRRCIRGQVLRCPGSRTRTGLGPVPATPARTRADETHLDCGPAGSPAAAGLPRLTTANPPKQCFSRVGCGGFCSQSSRSIHQHGPLFNYGPYYGYPPFEPYGPLERVPPVHRRLPGQWRRRPWTWPRARSRGLVRPRRHLQRRPRATARGPHGGWFHGDGCGQARPLPRAQVLAAPRLVRRRLHAVARPTRSTRRTTDAVSRYAGRRRAGASGRVLRRTTARSIRPDSPPRAGSRSDSMSGTLRVPFGRASAQLSMPEHRDHHGKETAEMMTLR